MLNQDSLSQLRGLKTQMEAEKEHAEAVVKGTQARYGFAVLDDGREIFIPPDEMLKAFPEDRVQVCIRPTKDKRTVADIEKLLSSPLEVFNGRCVRKGKAMFVQPDLPHLSRWLFIPPHARNGVQEGDFIRCGLLRHPIKDGKPQAKVLTVLGNQDQAGIENLYCRTKYELPGDWPASCAEKLQPLIDAAQPLQTGTRRDLTDLEYVSIDAAKTQDIDDALYAAISDDGWTLYVAIADPTAYIERDSDLFGEIAKRGTSVYFHGDVLPMMPEVLSQETCALAEGVDRPALICKISVRDSGEVTDYEFIEGTVRSRAKLSYYAVDRYLSGNNDELMSHATPLEALYQVYRALRDYRSSHELVMEDRREYRWQLDENKKVQAIEPSEKLLSQRLVEECMVAANRCAADFLSQQKATGPFVSHPGFRPDREDETRKFLQRYLPELAEADLNHLDTYRAIMRAASAPEQTLPLRSMLNRLLSRAELSTEPKVHMGMGLPAYTNCTSPLRKFADFLVHLQIKDALHQRTPDWVKPELLQNVGQAIFRTRKATQEAERWLTSQYLLRLAATHSSFRATVCHINSSGFSARLLDTGIEGLVDLRKDSEKFSFDKWTSSLTSTSRRFELDQEVEVQLQQVEEPGYRIHFNLVPDCGLKAPKAEGKAPQPATTEEPAATTSPEVTAPPADKSDARPEG